MRLRITKDRDLFEVDDAHQPGSPAVGRGRTMKEAIGDYFHVNQKMLNITFEVDAAAMPAEMRRRRRELRRRTIMTNWMKKELTFVTAMVVAISLFAAMVSAAQLTFVTKALDSHDREYTAYLDLSTKHMEGTYTVITSYALWDPTITSDGYSGIKWYKNILQMDCARNVKRLTYIGYLDVNGNVIVEESYPDAQDEAISPDLVDSKEKPYYCGR